MVVKEGSNFANRSIESYILIKARKFFERMLYVRKFMRATLESYTLIWLFRNESEMYVRSPSRNRASLDENEYTERTRSGRFIMYWVCNLSMDLWMNTWIILLISLSGYAKLESCALEINIGPNKGWLEKFDLQLRRSDSKS